MAVIKVYAKDLKVGNVTDLNGKVEKVSGTPVHFYNGVTDEPYDIGVRYVGRVGMHVLAPHDVVTLTRL